MCNQNTKRPSPIFAYPFLRAPCSTFHNPERGNSPIIITPGHAMLHVLSPKTKNIAILSSLKICTGRLQCMLSKRSQYLWGVSKGTCTLERMSSGSRWSRVQLKRNDRRGLRVGEWYHLANHKGHQCIGLPAGSNGSIPAAMPWDLGLHVVSR